MARPVHFEIHATDPEQAKAFYEAVFGWRIEQWGTNPYWTVNTGDGPGINGGLLPRKGPRPAADTPVGSFVLTVETPDLTAAMATVVRHGGSVAVDKAPVPNVGWLAYVADMDGNLFGLVEPDTSAS
jgi:predicted enzyme related to lactoylglutathione lyase